MPQAIGADDENVVRSKVLLEARDQGEGISDQAPTHMETEDDAVRGDRIDGGPDGSAWSVAMAGSHPLIEFELQEGAPRRICTGLLAPLVDRGRQKSIHDKRRDLGMDRHYVKQVDHVATDQPGWAIYERTEVGPRTVCVCYDEATALRIRQLLVRDDQEAEVF